MSRVQYKAGKQSDVRTSEKAVKTSVTKSSLHYEAEYASSRTMQQGGDDLESFFSVGSRSNSVPRSRAPTLVRTMDATITILILTLIGLYHSLSLLFLGHSV